MFIFEWPAIFGYLMIMTGWYGRCRIKNQEQNIWNLEEFRQYEKSRYICPRMAFTPFDASALKILSGFYFIRMKMHFIPSMTQVEISGITYL